MARCSAAKAIGDPRTNFSRLCHFFIEFTDAQRLEFVEANSLTELVVASGIEEDKPMGQVAYGA